MTKSGRTAFYLSDPLKPLKKTDRAFKPKFERVTSEQRAQEKVD
jgi:hypothetical protein